MCAQIIEGKKISDLIREEMITETAALKEKGVVPGLAVVLVGEDPASKVYVGSKEKGLSAAWFLFRSTPAFC